METNKEKAIREAYGEYWELAKKRGLDAFGYIGSSINGDFKDWEKRNKNIFNNLDLIFKKTTVSWFLLPKSLKGIETNNGWIKIESESDLPSEDCDCHIEFEDGAISIDRYFVFGKNFTYNHWKHIVAYRLIEQPKKRIY